MMKVIEINYILNKQKLSAIQFEHFETENRNSKLNLDEPGPVSWKEGEHNRIQNGNTIRPNRFQPLCGIETNNSSLPWPPQTFFLPYRRRSSSIQHDTYSTN